MNWWKRKALGVPKSMKQVEKFIFKS